MAGAKREGVFFCFFSLFLSLSLSNLMSAAIACCLLLLLYYTDAAILCR